MSSTTDTPPTPEKLAENIDERLDRVCAEFIRAIVRYDGDSIQIHRMNEHADDGASPEQKLPLLKQTTGYRPVPGPYGDHAGTIYAFADVVLVHVPAGPDSGVVATLDPDVGGTVPLAEILPDW